MYIGLVISSRANEYRALASFGHFGIDFYQKKKKKNKTKGKNDL